MGWILLIAGGFAGWRSGYFDGHSIAALAVFALVLEVFTVFLINQFVHIQLSAEFLLSVGQDWVILCAFGLVGFLFGMWLKKKQVRDFGE